MPRPALPTAIPPLTSASTTQPQPTDLDVAARIVTRRGAVGRAERIVYALDGMSHPVKVDLVDQIGQVLWERAANIVPGLRTSGSGDHTDAADLVLGLDAGGILPATAVARAARLPYRLAWKLDLDLPGQIRFTEPHANRPDVYAYGIAPGTRIVVVDDEVTTGRTLANLIEALRQADVVPLALLCVVEDTRHHARQTLADATGLPLVSLHTIDTPAPASTSAPA